MVFGSTRARDGGRRQESSKTGKRAGRDQGAPAAGAGRTVRGASAQFLFSLGQCGDGLWRRHRRATESYDRLIGRDPRKGGYWEP